MLAVDLAKAFDRNECDFGVRALVCEELHGHFIISECISSPSFDAIISGHAFGPSGVSRKLTKLSIIAVSFLLAIKKLWL